MRCRGARLLAASVLLVLATAAAALAPAAAASPGSTANPSQGPACQDDFGTQTPVVLVHGFHEGTDVWSSLETAIDNNIPAAKVVTLFDYPNTAWVTDPSIGQKLGQLISCLADHSAAGKVIVVAHSMGGLAVRCAVAQECAGTAAANPKQVGLEITLGTPNTGSLLATVGNGLSTTGTLSCEAILALETGLVQPCPDLLGWLFGANSPAALALQSGLDGKESQDLASLPALPAAVPLDALAGQVTLTTSLFALGPFHVTGPTLGDLGDLVVPEASALDGAPPTSPAHAGTSSPHPGSGSGAATIPCGTVSVATVTGPNAGLGVVPYVTCWHETETTNAAWQADVLAAIKAAAASFPLPACTAAALTSAINAANATRATTTNWRLTNFACESGYAYTEIEPVGGGLAVVAILQQQDGTWKIIYGPNEGICLDQPATGPCQGFKQPIPLPLLQSLIAKATPSPTPELYVHNGYELGSLYAYPNFPAKIALDNGAYLSGLNWTQVSPSGATATGTLNVNNCTPSCAGGSYVQTQVRLQASDPQQCSVSVFSPDSDVSQQEQAYVFNQLQVTALTGSLPSWVAGPSPPVLPAACS